MFSTIDEFERRQMRAELSAFLTANLSNPHAGWRRVLARAGEWSGFGGRRRNAGQRTGQTVENLLRLMMGSS